MLDDFSSFNFLMLMTAASSLVSMSASRHSRLVILLLEMSAAPSLSQKVANWLARHLSTEIRFPNDSDSVSVVEAAAMANALAAAAAALLQSFFLRHGVTTHYEENASFNPIPHG